MCLCDIQLDGHVEEIETGTGQLPHLVEDNSSKSKVSPLGKPAGQIGIGMILNPCFMYTVHIPVFDTYKFAIGTFTCLFPQA